MGDGATPVATEQYDPEATDTAYITPMVDFVLVATLTLIVVISTGVFLLVPA